MSVEDRIASPGSSAAMPWTLQPPEALLGKLAFYRKRYGLLHAVASYAGRCYQPLWTLIGRMITKRYLARWLLQPGPHILNLGGGSNCISGCLTVDTDPRADAFVDITRRLPFPDRSVDAIFCEEVIEHVDAVQGGKFLEECWRILVPGGVLRLTTPDLNWFAERVLRNDSAAGAEINAIFYRHRHRYVYSRADLERACREANFGNMRQSCYRDSIAALGRFDSHADRFHHPPEMCQYLEARRPDAG